MSNKLSMLVMALVVGTSTVALADHRLAGSARGGLRLETRSGTRPAIRDHRQGKRFETPPPRGQAYAYGHCDDVYEVEHPALMFPSNTNVGLGASVYIGPTPTFKAPGHMVALTEPTRIDSSVLYLGLSPRLGTMSEIALQQVAGSTYVYVVKIQYASGAWQVERPAVTLDSGEPVLRIGLSRPESVLRVEIQGDSAPGAALLVLGR